MQKHHIPGVSIAIVQDGKVVLAKGYGLANVELSVPATEHTVYQLASVTKTFTATAIMMLVEEGKLRLDDKITERLPDLPAAWHEVTIRHLLNHTSGIKSYTSVRDFHKTTRKDYARRETPRPGGEGAAGIRAGREVELLQYGLLPARDAHREGDRQEIRRVPGRAHLQAARHDADPRERPASHHPGPRQGYDWNGKELRNGEYVSPTQPFAAGMLVSTVNDLVKWDAALSEERLLKHPPWNRCGRRPD